MANDKQIYRIDVDELQRHLEETPKFTVELKKGEKVIKLFDIQRVRLPDGTVEDTNNNLC